jgi:two-component system OmpR family response regulator
MLLLLCCDDAEFAHDLTVLLRHRGHEVDSRSPGIPPNAAADMPPDVMLAEWPSPACPGTQWLRDWRRSQPGMALWLLTDAAGMALLTAQLATVDCAFVLKPIAPQALAERLCHAFGHTPSDAAVRLGDGEVQVDRRRRTVQRRGRPVSLTPSEWLILDTLLLEPGRVVAKREMAARVIDGASAPINALEVHLSNVRRKLGRDLIETIRGRGYRIRP